MLCLFICFENKSVKIRDSVKVIHFTAIPSYPQNKTDKLEYFQILFFGFKAAGKGADDLSETNTFKTVAPASRIASKSAVPFCSI